jgi:hypothetical protein
MVLLCSNGPVLGLLLISCPFYLMHYKWVFVNYAHLASYHLHETLTQLHERLVISSFWSVKEGPSILYCR